MVKKTQDKETEEAPEVKEELEVDETVKFLNMRNE